MLKKILLTLFVFIVCGSPIITFADTIYLKDGRVIEGKIIEQSSYATMVEEGGFVQRYYNDQISRIEKTAEQKPITSADIDRYQFVGISPEKVNLILRLMDANGTRQAMETNLNQILLQASAQDAAQLKELIDINEIVENMIPVFDTYYTEDELKQLLDFYQSPLGQKVLRVTPLMMKDTLQATLNYFKNKASL